LIWAAFLEVFMENTLVLPYKISWRVHTVTCPQILKHQLLQAGQPVSLPEISRAGGLKWNTL